MDFKLIDRITEAFELGDIKFKNSLSNEIYEELLHDLNLFSNAIYAQIIENKNFLEKITLTIDFMAKRLEAKQKLIRSCLEVDLIIQNTERLIFVSSDNGDIDA